VADFTSQHQTSVFVRPVRKDMDAVDANEVRGNDNRMRESLNAHDADKEAHVGGASTFAMNFLLMGG